MFGVARRAFESIAWEESPLGTAILDRPNPAQRARQRFQLVEEIVMPPGHDKIGLWGGHPFHPLVSAPHVVLPPDAARRLDRQAHHPASKTAETGSEIRQAGKVQHDGRLGRYHESASPRRPWKRRRPARRG